MNKIIALGGSVAAGFGTESSYSKILAEKLGYELVDATRPHCYIRDSIEILPTLGIAAGDLVVVQHGLAESLIRPRRDGRFAQRVGSLAVRRMDPSPYASRRRLRQWFRQNLRSLHKWLLLVTGQSRPEYTPDQYAAGVRELIARINRDAPGTRIIFVSPIRAHRAYFPLANLTFQIYWRRISSLLTMQNLLSVDIFRALDQKKHYTLDRFHPNLEGHTLIADRILECLYANGHLKK